MCSCSTHEEARSGEEDDGREGHSAEAQGEAAAAGRREEKERSAAGDPAKGCERSAVGPEKGSETAPCVRRRRGTKGEGIRRSDRCKGDGAEEASAASEEGEADGDSNCEGEADGGCHWVPLPQGISHLPRSRQEWKYRKVHPQATCGKASPGTTSTIVSHLILVICFASLYNVIIQGRPQKVAKKDGTAAKTELIGVQDLLIKQLREHVSSLGEDVKKLTDEKQQVHRNESCVR